MGRGYQKYLIHTSTNTDIAEYISQAEAARIRGVSNQALSDLIRRGKLSVVVVAGRKLLLRSEVEAFVAQPRTGRPPRKQIKRSARKKEKGIGQ